MKHGPIALVDAETPSVFLVPRSATFDKVMSNLEEIKARGGPVLAIAGEDDIDVAALADDVICVSEAPRLATAGGGGGAFAALRPSCRSPARLRCR